MASFPTSKYARYKRATAFFLDWLLRARGRGRRSGKRVLLDEFNEVVSEIEAKPSTLTPKLLAELPKALAACQCSITFREHVATFFAADDENQAGHRHFLELLNSWYNSLKQVELQQQTVDSVTSNRFENYYEVLQVDEDYFPDEETFVAEKGAPKRARIDRERLFDQAFAEDLRLEIAYFFLEMEELVEEVFHVYEQVKRQERTMMEATVVVKVAMDLADSLTAGLQIRYPALKTAEDLLFVLLDHPSSSLRDQIAKAAAAAQEKFDKDGTYKFVPGMLLNDFTNVWWTLASFGSTVGEKEDENDTYWNMVILPEGYYGENYGEERTPQYVLPDSSNVIIFLMQQLPILYNTIRSQRTRTGSGYTRKELVGTFMALFDEYFETRQVTIPLVFTCVCWIKSVTALQGNAGLSRNVSLTFKHSRDLMARMDAAVAKGYSNLLSLTQDCATKIKESTSGHVLSRTNPLLAGFVMATHDIKFMLLANGDLLNGNRLRAFGHLYNALVKEEFLQPIPFLDDLLEVYDDIVFTPSRAAAVHGAYNRVYLLSGHHSAATVDSVYRGVLPFGKEKVKKRKDPTDDPSPTYRLLFESDLSSLRGVSPKAMLKKAAGICSIDLFGTRILSRDLMTLNDDLIDTFSEMCDTLGRRQFHDEHVADPEPSEARRKSIEYGLVDAVMVPLLALLDARQHDESMKWSALPVGMLTHRECAVSGGQVRNMCEKVAAVIKARFALPPLACEQKYFTFPAKPDHVNQEFGSYQTLLKETTANETREKVFLDLMTLMKNATAPLSGKDLTYLKAEIKMDPQLLRHWAPCSPPSASSSSETVSDASGADLCTLLHQAAAGPAHELTLVEWMIQMGALIYQPMHCRKEPPNSDLTDSSASLPNTMALHAAMIAGYGDIARLVLEADNMIDLNTATFHTKETLSHLTVKHGHRDLFHMLRCFGANTHIKDGNGSRVRDMAADRGWAAESAQISASPPPKLKENVSGSKESKRERKFDDRFCQQVTLRSQRLRNLVFIENIDVTPDSRLKRSNKKKKGGKGTKQSWKGGNASAKSSTGPETANVQRPLDVKSTTSKNNCDGSNRSSSVEKSIAKTSARFARLRDPNVPAINKCEDAERVGQNIERLEGLIEVLSDPSRLEKHSVEMRTKVSFEAYRVIHLMQKFHRVDHAAIQATVLDHIRQLCATSTAFTKFVLGTAQMCISVSRKSQALEILDILEKRFIKAHKQNHERRELQDLFRIYSSARDALGLGPTSDNAMFLRGLYLGESVDDKQLQVNAGAMAGKPFYFELTAKSDTSDRQFQEFTRVVCSTSALDGVACFDTGDKHVVYGTNTEGDMAKVLQLVHEVAQREGIQLESSKSHPCTNAEDVDQFRFSSAGVAA